MALVYFAFMLSACLAPPISAPTAVVRAPSVIAAEENPHAPKPEDAQLNRAEIIVASVDLSDRADLDPVRVQVNFLGSMPGVCKELRLQVKPPDEQYRIFIEAYSVANPKIKCPNVFQQFETNILLGVYTSGKYSVWVNEKFVGDFISY
ncbi:MAG: hypothetical protein PHQ36_02965 [Anaerolineales bacterium]|nr:hypothetical protein [Anaerolineales bacterium]